MVEPARAAGRRTPSTILGAFVVVSAMLIGVLVYRSPASSSSTVASPTVVRNEHPGAPGEAGGVVTDGTTVLRREPRGALGDAVPDGMMALRHDQRGALGEADGAVPDGTTVFDDEIPGVTNLDSDLLAALRQAATEAADAGVEFFVTSGWRSPEYQERLLAEAVWEYGSEEEAARWVATAETSPHVSGDAVDIGSGNATAWLSAHGAEYGLCQVYSNEPWHYELRPEAMDAGCPAMYTDPTHDPRMQ